MGEVDLDHDLVSIYDRAFHDLETWHQERLQQFADLERDYPRIPGWFLWGYTRFFLWVYKHNRRLLERDRDRAFLRIRLLVRSVQNSKLFGTVKHLESIRDREVYSLVSRHNRNLETFLKWIAGEVYQSKERYDQVIDSRMDCFEDEISNPRQETIAMVEEREAVWAEFADKFQDLSLERNALVVPLREEFHREREALHTTYEARVVEATREVDARIKVLIETRDAKLKVLKPAEVGA